jgi:hypothetical protein
MSANTRLAIALLFATLPLAASSGTTDLPEGPTDILPFEDVSMIIEFNSTDLDVGIQFFLDVDGWQTADIIDPEGKQVFEVQTHGRTTRQGGGSELFVESVEPTLDELPLARFFHRFPAGVYTFRARGPDGEMFYGQTEFTHALPAGPVIITPVPRVGECARDVSIPAVIAWEPVTTSYFGQPIDIVEYEVIIESEHSNYDVHIPAGPTPQVTVSPEVLEPGTEYGFEVLAIEDGGNQTITESCFVTAD